MSGTISFTQLTFAVVNVKWMVKFYNLVLKANLEQVNPRVEMYEGMLVNIPLLMCSNELANVNAEQARHQFHFGVAYLDQALENVIVGGGLVEKYPEPDEKIRSAIVRDPDGNTLELVELMPRFELDREAIRAKTPQ